MLTFRVWKIACGSLSGRRKNDYFQMKVDELRHVFTQYDFVISVCGETNSVETHVINEDVGESILYIFGGNNKSTHRLIEDVTYRIKDFNQIYNNIAFLVNRADTHDSVIVLKSVGYANTP